MSLYDVAREVCHEAGMPWTDPRTGKTHEPPQQGDATEQTESLNETGAELIVHMCKDFRLHSIGEDWEIIRGIEGLARTIASTESAAPALLAACEVQEAADQCVGDGHGSSENDFSAACAHIPLGWTHGTPQEFAKSLRIAAIAAARSEASDAD